MTDYKFLSDGRKVVVIGQLNNVESIVQEIFVTESGDEIPSGERFTTKSLHDEPVISYKEKKIKDIENVINQIESERETASKKKENILTELKSYTDILKSTKVLVDNFKNEKELDTFCQFMTCNIEYLVIDGYTITPPFKMIDIVQEYSNYYSNERDYTGLKLLSVLGDSNGSLNYNINRYSDGSGNREGLTPFTNREDALVHIRDRAIRKIESDGLSEESYESCLDMGIVFDIETRTKFKEYMRDSVTTSITCAEKTIKDANERLLNCQKHLVKYS